MSSIQGVLIEGFHCIYIIVGNIAHYVRSADSQRRGKRKGLPSQSKVPSVPPEASVYQIVLSQLLDVLWSEVATILHPLVMAARERAMQGVYGCMYIQCGVGYMCCVRITMFGYMVRHAALGFLISRIHLGPIV